MVGYKQQYGRFWSGDLLIIDQGEYKEIEVAGTVYTKTINAKEVFPIKQDDSFQFPLTDGTLVRIHDTTPPRRKKRRKRKEREEDDEYEQPEEPAATEEEDRQKQSIGSPPVPERSGQDPDNDDDYWTLNDRVLQRIHRQPRQKLFQPDEIPCPIPLKYLDILRRTERDLDSAPERWREDFWTKDGPIELSSMWTGKTVFNLILPDPGKKYKWVQGRKTRRQKTTRPDSIRPEDWPGLADRQKEDEIRL